MGSVRRSQLQRTGTAGRVFVGVCAICIVVVVMTVPYWHWPERRLAGGAEGQDGRLASAFCPAVETAGYPHSGCSGGLRYHPHPWLAAFRSPPGAPESLRDNPRRVRRLRTERACDVGSWPCPLVKSVHRSCAVGAECDRCGRASVKEAGNRN